MIHLKNLWVVPNPKPRSLCQFPLCDQIQVKWGSNLCSTPHKNTKEARHIFLMSLFRSRIFLLNVFLDRLPLDINFVCGGGAVSCLRGGRTAGESPKPYGWWARVLPTRPSCISGADSLEGVRPPRLPLPTWGGGRSGPKINFRHFVPGKMKFLVC